jgi:hypothetical protein
MKIGVFGDSFADKSYTNGQASKIWYNFLQNEHGHTVNCLGEAGSSIVFSTKLIKQYASDYDLVIWCLTTPGRFSLSHTVKDRTVHITNAQQQCDFSDVEIQKKHSVCIDYLKYIFDWETENLIGCSLVQYLQNLYQHIMIIPCFPPPLNAKFNLYSLCQWEANFYFPGKSIPEIYKSYQDLRPGHITQENQKILAELLNQNLKPGVFQTSYDNFVPPTQLLQQTFKKL